MRAARRPTGVLRLTSDPTDVHRLLDLLDDVLGQAALDALRAFQFRSAVVEAFNNCCLHAYGGQPDRPIEIRWALEPACLAITVSDQGPEFRGPSTVRASDPLAESGRGFEIIHAGTDRLIFTSEAGWNHCRLEVRPG